MAEVPPLDLTYDQVREMSEDLAGQIQRHCEETGERFDKMLILPRGGLEPANLISRLFDFKAEDILSMSIGSYVPGTTIRGDKFRVGQVPSREDVEGFRILQVDEVGETMRTTQYSRDWCMRHGALLVRTGVLVDKPTLHEVDMNPDWFVMQTDKWVNFPWEHAEKRGTGSIVNARNAK